MAYLLDLRIRILLTLLCLCVLNLDRGDSDQRSRLWAIRIAIYEGGLDFAVAGFIGVDSSTFPLVWRSFQVRLLLGLNEKVGSSKVAIDDALGRPLLVVKLGRILKMRVYMRLLLSQTCSLLINCLFLDPFLLLLGHHGLPALAFDVCWRDWVVCKTADRVERVIVRAGIFRRVYPIL